MADSLGEENEEFFVGLENVVRTKDDGRDVVVPQDGIYEMAHFRFGPYNLKDEDEKELERENKMKDEHLE